MNVNEMTMKYILFLNLLIITVNASSSNVPEVQEDITEDESTENIRIARHPKFQVLPPPYFDFKKIEQQDPQRLRYTQQQQIDSYMRAYHQEQATKRPQKHRKAEKNTNTGLFDKTTYDNRPKSENRQPAPINYNRLSDRKKVDPINISNNAQDKKNNKQGYQVTELDQDIEPSRKHESRIYFGKEEVVKTVQDYPTSSLPANYLAKPTYVLANPQLSHLVLDPKTVNQAANYNLPPDHQLSHAGFHTASKSDLEALSSLIGQAPNAQLKGFNEILQQGYASSAPSISIPEPQHTSPEGQQIILKDILIQPQALVGHVKEQTPIKEEFTHVEPNYQTAAPHAQTKSHSKVNHEIKLIRESKSVYGDHDDKLQYAAQYAFGYKIRDFHSGNNFGHEEVREGDVAKGHYHVLLPDGRLQNVEYWADPS